MRYCTAASHLRSHVYVGAPPQIKTTKTEKKTESKTYPLVANDADDAKQWLEALLKGACRVAMRMPIALI